VSDKPKAVEDMTIEELREECHRANREAWGAERKVESLLRGRAQWERDAAAAIRRSEWEKVNIYGAQSARAKARNLVQPVEGVLYRVEQLGERAGAKQVTELKAAVREARHVLTYLTKDVDAEAAFNEGEAEAGRLREFVIDQGRALHADVSVGDSPCRCRGCNLIRAMDADSPLVETVIAELSKVVP
jgi:hypothetical protein